MLISEIYIDFVDSTQKLIRVTILFASNKYKSNHSGFLHLASTAFPLYSSQISIEPNFDSNVNI